MYLKRVELCGFKSFADKTKMDFEPGISAVVGPNGCGKSNISDSIRWCLGEQSAKSMRSKQMLDVIFGGSQSRPTTGMAEVTLTFDNTNNILPLDYSEISITRRLFRSGESEYFINRIQCRLKDVRDMFLDTGIGSEGYSIIEQGKVEFLLLASAEDRRELFEEAAGVSKYKVRREETLRKLDKVEIDMNRVNDMLALLKDQITALDIAAKKARQYQKHKTDLRRLEITSLVHAIARDTREIDSIKAEMDPQILTYEATNAAQNQAEAELADMRVMQIQKDDEYVAIQNEFSQIKSDINLADERIVQAEERGEELTQRRQTLTVEVQTGEQRIAQYEQELLQVQSLTQSLSAEVHILEQKYQSKETEIVEIRSAITNIVVRENATKEDLFSCAAQRTTLHNDQNRLISLQSHCQAQIAALKKDLERLLQNEDPINADIAVKQSEIDIAVASLEGTRATLTRIREQMGISEANITTSVDLQRTLNEKMIALESRANMIREWEQKDPVRGTMRVTMSAAIAGIRGPVSGLIDIDPGMEEIVGAALGDMLNYIVADTMDAAQKAIQLLKETNGGRLTFVVLECLPEHSHSKPIALPAAARSLLAIIQCAPAYERLVKFLCQNTMINGTEIYANAVVQGGSKISFDKPVLIEGQLHQLTQDTEKIRHELTLAAGSMNERNATLAALRDEYRAAEMECQKIELHNGWMEKQLADKREERELILTGISLNKRDISEKEIEEQQVIEQQNIIANKLTELLSREQSLNEDLLRHETDQHKQRTQEESVAPLLTEAKVVWATQSSELSSRQREEQKLSEMTADTRRQIEQYRQELSSIDAKTVELAAVRSAESTHLIELRVAQTTKERQVQSTYNERQGFLKILDEKTGIIVEMRQQVEALKQEIHNRQMDLRSFELKLQSSQQRLSEEYSAVYEELKTEFLALAVNEEEVTRLKRKIDAMGAVNLAAPEEYTALEERYNFLLTQQQDLLKAKEDMLEVIAKINHTTRDHFKQTFDKVRENFRILYHQLFEGGEADLVLTDESNLLETGVEIMAQPPGKKLQNITLLSGGEKALTAIALLFAFFMVRPSPFCILDEVDAPLDDANIGRYINMIKSFAERSQFLVVTHNKRTMEMADVLYGVTMEELGVSKIISIKLKKISELAAV